MSDRLRLERDLFLSLLNLGHIQDPEEALRGAIDLAARTLRADRAYLEVYSAASTAPVHAVHFGMSRDQVETARVRVSRGIITDAIADGRTINTPSAHLDSRYADRESVQRQQIEAVVCAPIGQSPVLGVLYLARRSGGGPFAPEDIELSELVVHHLVPVVRRLVEARDIQPDMTARWRRELDLAAVIGRSEALARVFEQVALVAKIDVPVLLTGPSGTGKSLVARAIHDNGPRRRAPFIQLNCANFSDELLESELFGAMRGAHSTANVTREGKVAAAKGGTLFLDEVAELSSGAQAKLLTLLQSGRYFPLGGTTEMRADVRVVTATNADLAERVEQKRFREDLFYRINVFPIAMPSVAERRQDIRLLAAHFAATSAQSYQGPPVPLSPAAIFHLETQQWSGNVRELENVVQRGYIRATGEGAVEIEPHHFSGERPGPRAAGPPTYHEAMRNFQRELIRGALDECDWNVTVTSERLQIARSHVYALMRALGIRK